jgi:hypothetical protein
MRSNVSQDLAAYPPRRSNSAAAVPSDRPLVGVGGTAGRAWAATKSDPMLKEQTVARKTAEAAGQEVVAGLTPPPGGHFLYSEPSRNRALTGIPPRAPDFRSPPSRVGR